MLSHTNNKKLLTRKFAKETVGNIIEGTAELVGIFEALCQGNAETGIGLDTQILDECESMFIAINRLMYEQESRLKHSQMMKIATEKGANYIADLRNKATEPTLFPQAI